MTLLDIVAVTLMLVLPAGIIVGFVYICIGGHRNDN